MKRLVSPALLAALVFSPLAARAGDSLLRISCDGADSGAEVTINGKFRGECPLDIKVKPGTLKLRLLKPVSKSRERVFELELRMGEDTVKKVEAVLEEKFTAAGQVDEDERLRVAQAEAQRKEAAQQAEIAERLRVQQAEQAAAQQREAEKAAAAAALVRADQELLAQQTDAAQAGQADARMALAERYQDGKGVAKDGEKAGYWYKQAAASGNLLATFLTGSASKSSPPEDVDAVKRMLKLPMTGQRMLSVQGHDKVVSTVAADPFFALPPGSGGAIFYSFPTMPASSSTSATCQRNGNQATVKGSNTFLKTTVPFEGIGLLGGLFFLEASSKTGFLQSTRGKIAAIESVNGTPFPLTLGKRFGLKFLHESSGTYGGVPTWMTMTCAVTDVRIQAASRVWQAAPQLICLTQFSVFQSVTRYAFEEVSGCFVTMRSQQF